MGCIAAARRGIIVAGQMTRPQQAAAALKMSEALGWPLVADILSGTGITPWLSMHETGRQTAAAEPA